MDSTSSSPGRGRLRFGRFDYAAFLTFASYAASSLAIPVVLVEMAEDLRFPLLEGGMATGGSFQIVRSLAKCASMLFAGFAAARWGNRRSLGAAVGTMGVGLLLSAAAPTYLLVLPALLLAGLGEGVVEGLGTPFVQDMHLNFGTGAFVGALGTAAFSAGMFLGRTGFESFVPQRHLKRLVVSVGLFGAAAPARPGTRERNGLSPDRVPC